MFYARLINVTPLHVSSKGDSENPFCRRPHKGWQRRHYVYESRHRRHVGIIELSCTCFIFFSRANWCIFFLADVPWWIKIVCVLQRRLLLRSTQSTNWTNAACCTIKPISMARSRQLKTASVCMYEFVCIGQLLTAGRRLSWHNWLYYIHSVAVIRIDCFEPILQSYAITLFTITTFINPTKITFRSHILVYMYYISLSSFAVYL